MSHVQAISERLVRRGFDVDVFTTDPAGQLPREETVNGVRVYRFKSWAPSDAYYFSSELRTHLAENSARYEIVHAHSYHAMPALYASQSKKGNRLVFTPHYHGTGHSPFRRLLHIPWKIYAKQILEESDRVISVSNFERSLLMKNFGLTSAKVILIPDGLDLQEFDSVGRERTVDPHGVVRILCVSRLEKYKGIQYVLECLTGLGDNFVLEVVGSGPYRKSLESEAARLGVSGRVRFFEKLDKPELLERYRGASVFVLLSKYEAYGIVVAEALASRVPCIVSRTSALTEWIDNTSCFGVEYPIDTTKLSGLVARVSQLSGVQRNGIMDWEEVTDRTIDLYDKLVN